MNILFFLKPKSDVIFLYNDNTLRQALEKMEFHRYSAIPVLDREGKYYGTLTEGDLLWTIKKNDNMDIKKAEDTSISSIKRYRDNIAIHINSRIEDLIGVVEEQNFVPVLDDRDLFIGIITRKDIINYFIKNIDLSK